ncbi:MAG: hypothetical protein ACYC5M_12165 [Anaerolineae bacterium]
MTDDRKRGLYTTLLILIVLAGVLPAVAAPGSAPAGGPAQVLQAYPYPSPDHVVYLPLVESAAFCPGAAQVLQNTGFEQGLAYWIWGGDPQASTFAAVAGAYSVWLGGYNYAVDTIRQDAIVPDYAETGAVYLSWLMYSNELPYEPRDRMEVLVYDAADNVLAEVSVDSGLARGAWYGLRLPIPNVASYRGQPLSVRIYGYTDGTLSTSWYVDEVWLRFGCGAVLAEEDGAEFTPLEGAPAPAEMDREKVVVGD